MEPTRVSSGAVAGALSGPWRLRDLVVVNDAVGRHARIEGEFPWHHHEDELSSFAAWTTTRV
jgi:hypothetical protein